MSIEQLKEDLKAVIGRVPTGPLTTAAEIGGYLKNDLLPFIESTVGEMEEMDGTIEDLVNQAQDVIHDATAQVFLGIITSGLLLVRELRTRVGSDRRLLDACKEWEDLARQGSELLEDITIPDDEDEEQEGAADGSPDPVSIVESPTLPPGAKA